MISIPALTSIMVERAQKWFRAAAFNEMKQIAKGWGLTGSYPSPIVKENSPINLNFSDHSRLTLSKRPHRSLGRTRTTVTP